MIREEFLELLNSNKIPDDCKLIKGSVVSQRCISLSQVLQSETLDERLVVVPDKLIWACYSKGNGVYSSDGDYIYNYHSGTFIQYLTKDRLIPVNIQNFKNKIERWRSSHMNEMEKRLQSVRNELEGAGKVPVAESNAFKGTEETNLAKLEAQAKREKLNKDITSSISNVQLADTKRLKAFNGARASLIGWIVDRDIQTKSRVKTTVAKDPTTKKPQLKENTPPAVVADLARGVDIDKQYLKTNSVLEVIQNAPGPVRFAVVKFPVAGLVPLEDLRDAGRKFDIDQNTPTEYVTKFFTKKEFAMTTVALIGERIAESPVTHADPSNVIVKLVGKPVTDKETQRVENRIVPVISVENKRTLITEGNYFPRTTFKTMSVADIKTAEDQKVANLSLFGNLFRSVASRDIPYNKLDASEKAKVTKDGDAIVSKFFDPSVGLPLGVKGVFTKTPLTNPEIVVKEEKPTKDLKGTTLRAISYNSATAAADEHGISPFKNPKFANFLSACGGELTEAKMKELYKKSSNKQAGASNKIELTSTQATKLYLAAALGNGVTGLKFSDALSQEDVNRIDEDLLAITNRFAAK